MSAVSDLNAQISGLRASIRTYQQRTDQLNSINSNMDFDCNIERVNMSRSNTELYFSSGISGATSVASISEKMQGPVEADVWTDPHLYGVKNNISSEIARCQAKISSLNDEISSIQARISAIEQAEKEEQERQAKKEKK